MPRSMLVRFTTVSVVATIFLPVGRSQSGDPQSVAEAARKAREKKKDAANKPAKVITDETLDVKKGDVQSAAAEEPKLAGAPDANTQTVPGTSGDPGNAAAKDGKRERLKKELTDLKEQIKQSLIDLDLLQRENRLDQDAYYSQTNYGSDTAGKQKLDDEKQQISSKQDEVAKLKAKLAGLQREMGESSSSQP